MRVVLAALFLSIRRVQRQPPARSRRPGRRTFTMGGDTLMRVIHKAFLFFALVLVAPAAAFAQASITGIVKDNTGAVVPGVTVEAASDVLIEKVRSTSTDNNGRFQLVNLRPGVY